MLIQELEEIGYRNFWQVLNAKDYGVPQNRERVFMVSILAEESDPKPEYVFPKPFLLEKRLKDVLEPKVDEKYYLKPEQVQRIVEHTERHKAKGNGFSHDFNDGGGYCGTITTAMGNRYTDTFIKDYE